MDLITCDSSSAKSTTLSNLTFAVCAKMKPPSIATKFDHEYWSTSTISTPVQNSLTPRSASFSSTIQYLQLLTINQVNLPFGFSPAASHKLAHPDGELATSRAAAKYGICMGLSSYATYPLEDVAAQGLGNPYFMQMCVLKDRSITLQLLARAESRSPA